MEVAWDTVKVSEPGLSNFTATTSSLYIYHPTATGNGKIRVDYVNGSFRDTTGLITVIVGNPARLAIEISRNSTGFELLNDTLVIGDSIKVFAAIYDTKNNFISNTSVDWSLNQSLGNLTPSSSSDSVVFYPTTIGVTSINANSTLYNLTDKTGLITVWAGKPDSLRRLSAANDTVLPKQIVELNVKLIDSLKNPVRDSVVHFSIGSGGGTLNAFTDTTDQLGMASVKFTAPQSVGTSKIYATLATLTDTAKFTITVIPASLAYYTIIPSTYSDTAGAALTVTVTAYDVFDNQLADDTTQTRIDVYGTKSGLNGKGVGITPKFNVLTNGQHIAVIRDSVKENIQIKVTGRFDTTKTAITEIITIREASPFVADFYPDSLSNVQSGQLGVALIDSSALIVKDRFGNAVNDTITVLWLPTFTASVSPAIRTTATDGIARTKWTLRTATASNDTMFGIVPVIGDTLRFIANILATGNDTLIRVSALADTDTVNLRLDNAFRVYVEDEFSNPQSGVKITFTLFSAPGGTDSAGFVATNGDYVTTLDTLTDINGFAEAVFHLGTKTGRYVIRASNPALKNPAVYDTVMAVHDVPRKLQILSGNNQTIQAGSLTDTLKVRITDVYANPIDNSSQYIYWETIYNGLPLANAGLIDILPSPPQNFATLDSSVIGTTSHSMAIGRVRQLSGFDTVRVYLRNADTVLFRSTVVNRSADSVLVFAGNRMTGISNGSAVTLKTLVKDTFGNVVPSVFVRYQITSGNATFAGPDSSQTDANGISTIFIKPGNADSTIINAFTAGAAISSDFQLYTLVYKDSSLVPDRVRRDTSISFSVVVYNNGPNAIKLDTNATSFSFTDGNIVYRTYLQFGDSMIAGNSLDTLDFRSDTINVNITGNTYTPFITISGSVPSLSQDINGTLSTNPNELEVLGVEVVSVKTSAPKVFSRGDTIIVKIEVRNTGNSPMTNTDYGLKTLPAGILQRIGTLNTTPIPAKGFTVFEDTVHILPSAPEGWAYVNAYYFGQIGSTNFADTTATTIDSIFIQSAADLSYLPLSLTPVFVSEGQSVTLRVSVRNDSAASVTLNPSQTYLRFNTDSVFLNVSQVVSGNGDVTELVFKPLNLTLLSGAYAGTLYLSGSENGGIFADTLLLGTDSLRVQTAVTAVRLILDSVIIATDTSVQNNDSLRIRLKITNTAEAPAILDSLRLRYFISGNPANGYWEANRLFILPDTLNGGLSRYYDFDVNIAPTADTGSVVFDAYLRARDQNSKLVVQKSNANETDSVYVRTQSNVQITAVSTPTADTVSLGQTGIPMNVAVTNFGASPYRVNSIRMLFTIGLYDTSLTQSLPDTIYGYQTKTYNFTASVRNNSAVGLDSLGAMVSGVDVLNGKSSSVTARGLDTLRILSPTQILLTSVQTQPVFVSRRQDSILVRVTLKNNGASVGQIDTVRLKFYDVSSASEASGFTYNIYSDVSDTIAGSGSKTFDFKVSVGAAADTGKIVIDAVMSGFDIVSGLAFYDSGAVTTDYWMVQIPAEPLVDSVYTTPISATKGQQNIPVYVRVRNIGEANAVMDSVKLRYYYGASPDYASFNDTLVSPIGSVIAENGQTILYTFNADIFSSAPSGWVRIFAEAFGKDQNHLKPVLDTTKQKYDSLTVQSPPSLIYVANSLIPDTVNKATVVSFALDVVNTGEAALVLNASTTLILRDVDSLKVNLRDTIIVESGVRRQLVFNSATINLRADSVYYPELLMLGTENGNNYTAYLPITNDSVKVLSASVAAADSLNFYNFSGDYINKIAANDSFIVRLLVRNNGGATIKNLAPEPVSPALSGSSIPTLYAGPVPASVNLASGDSVRFEWRYKADSSGSANFAVRAKGKDATTDSVIASNNLNAFLTITPPFADTIYAVSPLTQSIPVYTATDLTVRITDKNNIPAQLDSIRFIVRSGSGGFNDTSRVTKDSIVYSNTEGNATIRLYTSALVDVNTVSAILLSTTDDSVQFTVSTVPRGISYLRLQSDTNWIAGEEDSVIVAAYDQFGNLATNATGNIQLTQVPVSAMTFTPGGIEPLINGMARFAGRDTLAKGQTQIKATASSTGTQLLSHLINIRHNEAYRFADTLINITGVAYGNSVKLTAKVEDRYGNAVKDTVIRFSVLHPAQNGVLLTPAVVLTDSLGEASATYRTGDSVGLNVVAATKAVPLVGSNDTIYFNITTDSLDANASYIAGSLTPNRITRNQTVAFRARFENTGTFPILLRGDSTYIEFGAGANYFRANLDTNINRAIGAQGYSEITFRSAAVNLLTGKYPSTMDSAVIVLWGTVFDSSTNDYDTLKFRFGNNVLDTLTVQEPAQLVINSVAITQTRAVRGQDSIRVQYTVTNSGGTTARTITLKDSFAVGGTDATSFWTLTGGDALDSLASMQVANLTRYYRVNTNAPLGMNALSVRVRGLDNNDPSQITIANSYNPDSVEIFRSAVLTAIADSFRIYQNGGVIANNTVSAGDTFELRMKVRNDSGSVVTNLTPMPNYPDTTGSGQITFLGAPYISKTYLNSGDSAVIGWLIRANNNDLGTVNFAVSAQAQDSVNNGVIVKSGTVNRLLTIKHAIVDTILIVGADTVITSANGSVPLTVELRDRYNNLVIDSSVTFIAEKDSGGFNPTRTLKNTTLRSGSDGRVRLTYYAPITVQTVTLKAYLPYNNGDTVRYIIPVKPDVTNYYTLQNSSVWIAGQRDSITIRAYDQYGNLNTLDTGTVLLTGLPQDSSGFAPSALSLNNGLAVTFGRNTKAQTGFRYKAESVNLTVQKLSDPITVLHTTAYRFQEPDSIYYNNVIVGKQRLLTATALDTFNNPVDNLPLRFSVLDGLNNGNLYGSTTSYDTITGLNGSVSVIYTTATDEGINYVSVKDVAGSLNDSVVYKLQTVNPIAESNYELISMDPDTVSRNQNTVFRIVVANYGPYSVKLIPDSTRLDFANLDSSLSLSVSLDTLTKVLDDSAFTQIQFRPVTVHLPVAQYPFTGHTTAQVRIVGSILDTASGKLDTVGFTKSFAGKDTLVVRKPAQIAITAVSFERDSAVAGQNGLIINYTVVNSGQNAAVNVNWTDRFFSGGADVTNQWNLTNSTIPASIDSGIWTFNRTYRLANRSRIAYHAIRSYTSAVDEYDNTRITADSLLNQDSIKIIRPYNVQVTETVIDTVYADSLINRNQIVRMRSRVNNFGDEPVRMVMHFQSTGRGLIETYEADTLQGNSVTYVNTGYFHVQDFKGVETYTALIDSLFSLMTGDTLNITDSIIGNTKTLTVQDSAKLKVEIFTQLNPPDTQIVVSDSAAFSVYLRVTNVGDASLSADSIPVRLRLPIDYRFSLTGSRDTLVYVTKNVIKSVTAYSLDSTLVFRSISAVFDTVRSDFPLDRNNLRKAITYNDSAVARIQTNKVGRLVPLAFTVVAPQGAVDQEVSTLQEFVVRSRVTSLNRLSNIVARLNLPPGFATYDSLTQRIIPGSGTIIDSVQWRIIAPINPAANQVLTIEYRGVDSTTGNIRKDTTSRLTINVVRRPELSLEASITAPAGATDDTISTGQLFTVSAVVRNLGASHVSSGFIRITNPPGFSLTGSQIDSQQFVVDDTVKWQVQAPNTPTFRAIYNKLLSKFTDGSTARWSIPLRNERKEKAHLTIDNKTDGLHTLLDALIATADMGIHISTLPRDTNTGLSATAIKQSDTIKITVVDSAIISGLNLNLSVSQNVSTGQTFTLRASFEQNPSMTGRTASVQLPGLYRLVPGDSLQKSISDNDTIVLWSVIAPENITGTDQRFDTLRVNMTARDRNTNNPVTASASRTFQLQSKAELTLLARITQPVNAQDNFVSKGQTFMVEVIVRKSGRAGVTGSGSVGLNPASLIVRNPAVMNENFRSALTLPVDTTYDLSANDSTAYWYITAPEDTVISHPIQFTFGSLRPKDINTDLTAFIVNDFANLYVSTEEKSMRVSRVPTRKDSNRTVFLGQRIDSMLVLKLENMSSTTNTNAIMTQSFRFIVEQYNPGGEYKYNRVAWSNFIDSVFVYWRDTLIGHFQNTSSNNDTHTVIINNLYRSMSKRFDKTALIAFNNGLLTFKGKPDTVCFSVKLKNTAGPGISNYRVRLAGIDAYDFDSLSVFAQSNNPSDFPVPALDPMGRPVSDSTADLNTITVRVIDQSGSGQEQFSNFPNPFGSQARPSTRFVFVPAQNDEKATIEIYTMAGNLVCKISHPVRAQEIPDGFVWYGKNSSGQYVRNGVYLAVLKAKGMGKLKTKVLVTK